MFWLLQYHLPCCYICQRCASCLQCTIMHVRLCPLSGMGDISHLDLPGHCSHLKTHAQVFETRAQWSRYALTQPEAIAAEQGGRFNTTELHCTEYFPGVRWGEFTLPFHAIQQVVGTPNDAFSSMALADHHSRRSPASHRL